MIKNALCFATAAVLATSAFAGDFTVSGPYTKDNLKVFLIHGSENTEQDEILTLSEAMKKNKVKVYETGNVSQLAIENTGDKPVYIQAGDIVKGGRQDRAFSTDMLLEARSGKVPIGAFCVESARWNKRGSESAETFSVSDKRLSSREQKLAAKYHKNQSHVWREVDRTQRKMGKVLKAPVKDRRSNTSLQLTLENEAVEKNTQNYIKSLSGIVKGKDRVVGYAYAVNDVLSGADIYTNETLFAKLWPNLLEAAATEALAEKDAKAENARPVKTDTVKDWFAQADQAQPKKENIDKHTSVITQDAEATVRFDTVKGNNKKLIHRNYLSKK